MVADPSAMSIPCLCAQHAHVHTHVYMLQWVSKHMPMHADLPYHGSEVPYHALGTGLAPGHRPAILHILEIIHFSNMFGWTKFVDEFDKRCFDLDLVVPHLDCAARACSRRELP